MTRQPAEVLPRNATARRACHRRHRSLTRQPAEDLGGIEPPKRGCGEQRNALAISQWALVTSPKRRFLPQ